MTRQPVLDAAILAQGLHTQIIGKSLHYFRRVESTNDTAKTLAEQGAPEGTVVVASEQSAGRGRLGRPWASPPGGLWLSVILRPSWPAAEWPRLAFAASVAVASAIERSLGIPTQVKWPNDLVLDGRKLGGVLLEAAGSYVVVGIGLNANVRLSAFPPDLAAVVTSLEERLGYPVDLVGLTQEILRDLEHAYQAVLDDPHALMEQWRVRSITLGRHVRVVGAGAACEGVAESVDADGTLVVRTKTGLRRIVASDVSLRESPEVGR